MAPFYLILLLLVTLVVCRECTCPVPVESEKIDESLKKAAEDWTYSEGDPPPTTDCSNWVPRYVYPCFREAQEKRCPSFADRKYNVRCNEKSKRLMREAIPELEAYILEQFKLIEQKLVPITNWGEQKNKKWIEIAYTRIEEGFLALNKAIKD
jgi:hypothetical protein